MAHIALSLLAIDTNTLVCRHQVNIHSLSSIPNRSLAHTLQFGKALSWSGKPIFLPEIFALEARIILLAQKSLLPPFGLLMRTDRAESFQLLQPASQPANQPTRQPLAKTLFERPSWVVSRASKWTQVLARYTNSFAHSPANGAFKFGLIWWAW